MSPARCCGRPGTASRAGRCSCRSRPSTRCARSRPTACHPTSSRRSRPPSRRGSWRSAIPGVIHDADTAYADLPPYEGPPDPPAGHTHEWGDDVASRGRTPGAVTPWPRPAFTSQVADSAGSRRPGPPAASARRTVAGARGRPPGRDPVAPGRLRSIQGRVGSGQHLFPVLARVQGERHAAADRQVPGIRPAPAADLQLGDRRSDPLGGGRRGIERGVGHDHAGIPRRRTGSSVSRSRMTRASSADTSRRASSPAAWPSSSFESLEAIEVEHDERTRTRRRRGGTCSGPRGQCRAAADSASPVRASVVARILQLAG